MDNKLKEPFYKRWWLFIVLLAVFTIGAMTDSLVKVYDEPLKRDQITHKDKEEELEEGPKDENPEDEDLNEVSLVDSIKNKVGKITGTETNRDVKKIRLIEINQDKVLVNLNADDASSNNQIKTNISNETRDILEELSKLGEISEVVVFTYFPIKDEDGETNDDIVFKIAMTRETLDEINWDNFTTDNLENMADLYFEHPELNEEGILN